MHRNCCAFSMPRFSSKCLEICTALLGGDPVSFLCQLGGCPQGSANKVTGRQQLMRGLLIAMISAGSYLAVLTTANAMECKDSEVEFINRNNPHRTVHVHIAFG